jgi:hypothetical protein
MDSPTAQQSPTDHKTPQTDASTSDDKPEGMTKISAQDGPKSFRTIEICSYGDVYLVLSPDKPATNDNRGGPVQFKVSNDILCSGSTYFAGMRRAHCLDEGKQLSTATRDKPVSIVLCERAHEEAMNILLHALHYRQVPDTISENLLLEVAQHVDYYGCAQALKGVASHWIASVTKGHENLLLGLEASYLLDSAIDFAIVSWKLAIALDPECSLVELALKAASNLPSQALGEHLESSRC